MKVSVNLDEKLLYQLEMFSEINGVTKSEAIRFCIDTVLNQKLENNFTKMENILLDRWQNFENRLVKIMIRNSEYTLANFHLMKVLMDESFLSEKYGESHNNMLIKIVSHAKKQTLYDEIDGVNSSRNFKENMLESDIRKKSGDMNYNKRKNL